MLKVYTSRWANKDLAHLSCQPVGISRGKPRWRLPYRYRVLRQLAPSREVFSIEDPDEFTAAYLAQLAELGAEKVVSDLAQIAAEHGGRPLVLLCFEPPGEWCHRRTLSGYLEREAGIEVPELRPGDLPRRPGVVVQESLF